MTTIISVRLFNYFKTTLYKYITTLFLQKQLICRSRDSCLSLPWPGFEPGLSRPQREVLTTIRSRSLHASAMTPIISVRLFNYFKTTLYKYITTFFLQKQLICRTRDSCLSLLWPGFEPGLSRPQREVLTTIRSRPLHQRFCISHDNKSSVLDCSIILRQLRINIYQHFFCKSSCFAAPETHVYL